MAEDPDPEHVEACDNAYDAHRVEKKDPQCRFPCFCDGFKAGVEYERKKQDEALRSPKAWTF